MSENRAGTNKFKIGEVVQLNSGGPRMTVVEIENGGAVVCGWFDKDEKLRTQKFSVRAIGLAQPTLADVREFLSGTDK